MGKLVAMIPVWNEEKQFLSENLKDLSEYVDEIVILDDASTDGTVKLCKSFKKAIVHSLPRNLGWVNQKKLREKLYGLTILRKPSWILCPDADEIWENKFKIWVRKMMTKKYNWYSFHLLHFWTRDSFFQIESAKMKSRRLMFRFISNKPPGFLSMPIHGGSSPAWVFHDSNGQVTNFRVKHFGFVNKEQRLRRIKRNQKFNQKWYLKSIEYWERHPPSPRGKWVEG